MNGSNYEITIDIRPQRGQLHPSQFHPSGREKPFLSCRIEKMPTSFLVVGKKKVFVNGAGTRGKTLEMIEQGNHNFIFPPIRLIAFSKFPLGYKLRLFVVCTGTDD